MSPGCAPPAAPAGVDELDVLRLGRGPRVVLVHGSVVGPRVTWRHQRALAARWTLVMPHRPGFGASPALERGDFEAEAPAIARLLGGGAHLVGHSYGAVIALFAAALRPQAVRSLTVSEPGCLRMAAGDPRVDEQIGRAEQLFRHARELEPSELLRLFRGGVGSTNATPAKLHGELLAGARLLAHERPAWEADPPLEHLRRARFAKLVISGGHSPVFEAVCDAVATRMDARRAVIAGRKHNIPATGASYNALLESFLRKCERELAHP